MRLENVPFRIESEAVRAWYRFTGNRPSSRPFVSGDSFRGLATHVFEPGSRLDPRSVRRSEVVFVQSSEIDRFMDSVLPGFGEPFVLITHNGDRNPGRELMRLAEDRAVLHWFAQNLVFRHPKVSAVPIGLENRVHHTNGILGDFRRAGSHPSRVDRILYGFTVENNPQERVPAYTALRSCPVADGTQRLNARKYRRLLQRYWFVASPPGNGVDCHRTWEAFYLGIIPVLKKGPLWDMFPGLPALFVEDWEEVRGWSEGFLAESREALTFLDLPITGLSQ